MKRRMQNRSIWLQRCGADDIEKDSTSLPFVTLAKFYCTWGWKLDDGVRASGG